MTPESHDFLAPGVRARPGTLLIHFVRASGPGGQNVNKLSTKADLRIHLDDLAGLSAYARGRLQSLAGRHLTLAGELHFTSDSYRTQEGNRAEVMRQLRELLIAAAHRPKVRKKTKPSKGSKQRRIEGKKHRGEIKRMRQGREE